MHNKKEPKEATPQLCRKCLRRLTLIELKGGKVEKWCAHCDGPVRSGG